MKTTYSFLDWIFCVLILSVVGIGVLSMASMASIGVGAGDNIVDQSRTISVNATGSVTAEPDMAVISVGVTTENKNAGVALRQNNVQMADVFGVLDKFDIENKYRKTIGLSIRPKYHYVQNQERVFDGYVVTNNVQVMICDLDIVGKLIDAVVQDGANKIDNIHFTFENPTSLETKARMAALESAKTKAAEMAEALCTELGHVLKISGHVNQRNTGSQIHMRSVAGDVAESVPVAGGQQAVTASVSVTFLLK